MLYQNMMKRSGSIAATIVQAQHKSKTKDTMPDRMTAVIDYTKKTSEEIKEMQKSDWKKIVKKALDKKVNERLKKEMFGKSKSRFIMGDQWRRKKYLKEERGNLAITILKICLCITKRVISKHSMKIFLVQGVR